MTLFALIFIPLTFVLITTSISLHMPSETGFCPIPAGGTCATKCRTDLRCRKRSKCCFNGCGYECMRASVTPCPDGSMPVQCTVNPCDVTDCPAHPEAICIANYCGGCNTIFFVGGKKVVCSVLT